MWFFPRHPRESILKLKLVINTAVEQYMSMKTRIAIQVSEHFQRIISPYDFTISGATDSRGHDYHLNVS
jgi:hypothetical protein